MGLLHAPATPLPYIDKRRVPSAWQLARNMARQQEKLAAGGENSYLNITIAYYVTIYSGQTYSMPFPPLHHLGQETLLSSSGRCRPQAGGNAGP